MSNAVKTKDLVPYKYHNSILPSSSILYCSSFPPLVYFFLSFFISAACEMQKSGTNGRTTSCRRALQHSASGTSAVHTCSTFAFTPFPLPHFFAYLVFSERGAGQLTSVEGFFHETPLTTSTLLFLSSFSFNFLPFLCASSYVCALARTKRR